jgi:hypothetical protein
MPHGKNAEKDGHAGKEYWKSRYSPGGEIPGKFIKEKTHRRERQKAKEEARRKLNGG